MRPTYDLRVPRIRKQMIFKQNVFKQDVFRNLDPPIRTPEDISLHSLKEQELNFKLIANEEESN